MYEIIYYTLNDDHSVTAHHDVLEWAASSEKHNRRIALTDARYGSYVSTVFLGIDHSFDDGPPLIFETMVFGGPLNEMQWRYPTYHAALEGHAAALRLANSVPYWKYALLRLDGITYRLDRQIRLYFSRFIRRLKACWLWVYALFR